MNDIAVVVTCHEAYLKWLPVALESIDRQAPEPAQRVLVVDGCQPAAAVGREWRRVEGTWGHPSGARNAGLAATTTPWVVFWDADNVMLPGYLAAVHRATSSAPPNLGIIYPDIHYCDEALQPRSLWRTPEWDYWQLRAENCIDTAAAWRRAALDMAGGWSQRAGGHDDYALALDVTALGWRATKLHGPPIRMRVHQASWLQSRLREGGMLTDLWRARSLAIVTLLAGRDNTFGRWERFLHRAELPPRTALYVVDNSGRAEFTDRAFAACREIAAARRLTHLDFASCGRAYEAAPGETYFALERHRQVAQLYAAVLSRVREDLVLTLEDDVEPPPDAVRKLGEEIGYLSRSKIGVVAGAYAMPHSLDQVCAGVGDGPHPWGGPLRWGDLSDGPLEAQSVGGGCAVWANWALRAGPVHLRWDEMLGWDGVLCGELRRQGYGVWLHGGVRCQHHLHGRVTTAAAPLTPATAPGAGNGGLPVPAPATGGTSGATEAGAERGEATTPPVAPGDPHAVPLPERLAQSWDRAAAGDEVARSSWQTVEGGAWTWQDGGVRVARGDSEWAGLSWGECGSATLVGLRNFVVEVTVSGAAGAAGLSFGPFKDFLVAPLAPAHESHRLQVEVDGAAQRWTYRVDGQIMPRQWWDSAVIGTADLLGGTLTLKARAAEQVIFRDLAVRRFQASCELSVIMTCYRFAQRLRVALRSWCHQDLPAGQYEVLVVNPGSPDGTHEHLASVAAGYPNVRVREVAVEPRLATNKGAMINRAVAASRGAWIWLTDADCLFSPGSAATALDVIRGRERGLLFGQRRYLSAGQTSGLLSGSIDGCRDFDALAGAATSRDPENAPWGYTQIVDRATFERIRYREDLNHFAHSDGSFVERCRRLGLVPEQIEGLVCLHLDHPFAWYGTDAFL